MFLKFTRYLISNKYFWKYRHFFQPSIFKNTYGISPRKHFNKVFNKIRINSVLDFGCATGDKLEYFVSRKKQKSGGGVKYIYGIDINPNAINTASNKLLNFTIKQKFSTDLKILEVSEYLKNNKLKKFDLVVASRVFFILNKKELYCTLKILSKITKYIYIDDFFHDDKLPLRKNIKSYFHTNFNLILKKLSFKKIYSSNSPYRKVIYSTSKSVLYKKME
jgi:SAM-dependent methyltransferase